MPRLFCILAALLALALPGLALALTNAPEEELQLRPPLSEVPPTFWEANAPYVAGAAAAAVAGVSAAVFFFTRPRRKREIPPAVLARTELEALRNEPENGVILSRISHTVRSYLQAAFQLGGGELMTTEVARALDQRPEVGKELAHAAREFLQDCDVRKFAPAAPPHSSRAFEAAVKIVDLAEQRIQRHAAASSTAASTPNGPREGLTADP